MKKISNSKKKKNLRKIPPDKVLDSLISYINKKYESSAPHLREWYRINFDKEIIKIRWYKKLKLNIENPPNLVGEKEVKFVWEVAIELQEEMISLVTNEIVRRYDKSNSNQAVLGTADLIRRFEKMKAFSNNERKKEYYTKLLSSLRADLDFYKIKRGIRFFWNEESSGLKEPDTVDDDINDKPSINFKKEVTEFVNRMIETEELDLNDNYFVREAKRKFIAELSKRLNVELSNANRESIRTYLSKFKSSYIEEKRKGKKKKK